MTITRGGDQTRLLDSRSLNGTWVNGEQVVSTTLSDGDAIDLGPLVVRFVEIR